MVRYTVRLRIPHSHVDRLSRIATVITDLHERRVKSIHRRVRDLLPELPDHLKPDNVDEIIYALRTGNFDRADEFRNIVEKWKIHFRQKAAVDRRYMKHFNKAVEILELLESLNRNLREVVVRVDSRRLEELQRLVEGSGGEMGELKVMGIPVSKTDPIINQFSAVYQFLRTILRVPPRGKPRSPAPL